MKKRERNHIDLALFFAVLTLMVLSLAVVYSASSTFALVKAGGSGKLLESHAIKVLAGFVAIFLFMQIDYHRYRKLTKRVLLVVLALLVVTLILGIAVKGASRWIRYGGFSLQPSEFAKYALIFHLAVLIAEKKERVTEFVNGFIPMVVWIGATTLLVLLQPNFSTGALIVAISVFMLYLGKAKLSHLGITVLAVLPLLVLYMVSAEYRMRRIMSYAGAGDTSHQNYQLQQSIIGFGNGGLFGLGPGASRQRDGFLPESYGDFVFSIIGEEYGLIGTILIMALFLIIMLRGLKIAKHAPDELGRMMALGITTAISLYALINAGVTLGILPTTGLPMPFISYGGTAIVVSASAIGVLLNISTQTDLHPRVTGAPESVRPLEPRPAVGKVY
jgi:cell division protein FtsW